MKSRFLRAFSVVLMLSLIALGTSLGDSSIGAYSAGPDPALTGGFNEITCKQSGCHDAFDLNAGKAAELGDVVIEGFPMKYEPGMTYPIRLSVTHLTDRKLWGFQLAARVKATGAQAGTLKPIDDSTIVVEEKGIQYIEHTLNGNRTNVFNFSWVAPSNPAGDVQVNAAGNAANGDESPEGDYIYSTSVTVAQ